MAIIKGDEILNSALNNMLQGLAFWMGLCQATKDVIYEHDCVHEACTILRSLLGKDYTIKYEYAYNKLDKQIQKQDRADLVVLKRQADKTDNKKTVAMPVCVMEFKMSSGTNSGILADVKKLLQISTPDIMRLVILVYKNESSLAKELYLDEVGNDFEAKRGAIHLSDKHGTYIVHVRRVTKAFAAVNNSKRLPYMAICIGV